MTDDRRFGLRAIVRHHIYRFIGLPIFGVILFGGDYRWIGFILFMIAFVWIGVVDPIDKKGERTFLGLSKKQAGRWGFGSVFGKKTAD